jgi:hypothetical protein
MKTFAGIGNVPVLGQNGNYCVSRLSAASSKGGTLCTVIPKRSLARGISRDMSDLNALSRLFYQETTVCEVIDGW